MRAMPEASEKRRVLVVDDDEKIRNIIRHVLEKAGFEVYTAPDGDAGVKAAVTSQPHAILLDVMMPVKDGFQTCGELKRLERTRDVPVIFLTARHGEEPLTKAKYRGATAYLEKPFHNEALVALVTEVIDAHERPEPAPAPAAPEKRKKKR